MEIRKTFKNLEIGDELWCITKAGKVHKRTVEKIKSSLSGIEVFGENLYLELKPEDLDSDVKSTTYFHTLMGFNLDSLFLRASEEINEECEKEVSKVILKYQEQINKLDENISRARNRK